MFVQLGKLKQDFNCGTSFENTWKGQSKKLETQNNTSLKMLNTQLLISFQIGHKSIQQMFLNPPFPGINIRLN